MDLSISTYRKIKFNKKNRINQRSRNILKVLRKERMKISFTLRKIRTRTLARRAQQTNPNHLKLPALQIRKILLPRMQSLIKCKTC